MNKQAVEVFARAFFPQFAFAFVFFLVFPYLLSFIGGSFEIAYLTQWGERDKDLLVEKALFMAFAFGLGGVHSAYRLKQESRSDIAKTTKCFLLCFIAAFIVLLALPYIIAYIPADFFDSLAAQWQQHTLWVAFSLATMSACAVVLWCYFFGKSSGQVS
ncbi:hypothetical protein [Helicobacter sp. MIT 01-3238]|uniref:hypothetical protein n=1 Tax=Helicobacter sp. MIT 01-3238 TaxID=398627 RepID=UPI000E1EA60C|nr:hypothetical protein [Helicobacter sp. MIT 01-3238]RDU52642.1 hypothetical protein CQA40_06845 [Helicobacter sp. MIT 01-3238]